MEFGKLLVSGCLLGEAVRYDGGSQLLVHGFLKRLQTEGRIVSVCPEMMGGLPVPRPPAEVQLDYQPLLVKTISDIDVTAAFLTGAQKALAVALEHKCRFALMAARSPSCGNEETYDGTFSGRLVKGQGVAASLLSHHGIRVFNQDQIGELEQAMQEVEPYSCSVL